MADPTIARSEVREMPRSRIDRRQFLQSTTMFGLTGFWTGRLSGDDRKAGPNDKLHVGVIGLGGQGKFSWNTLGGIDTCEVVALCDVDESRSGEARQRFPKAAYFQDYRKLIEHKGLQAVAVCTPDHTHAVCTMAAMKNGLHAYCEKPLTHNVWEARQLAEYATKNQRVTQMGTQVHASENYRRVVELIQAGAIGVVKEVHVWVAKEWSGGAWPTEWPEVPKSIDWNLWLGPAPEHKFSPKFHPAKWRGWWDFGGGTTADMGCHLIDVVHWALDLRAPEKIAAEGPPVDKYSAPAWQVVTYDYPARDKQPAMRMVWYCGKEGLEKRPQNVLDAAAGWGDGSLWIGDKGQMLVNYGQAKLLPEDQFKDYKRPEPSIPKSIGHHREWIEACRSGGPTTCNFDYSGALTEAVLLGNVAYRTGKPIVWDAAALKVTNDVEANQFLRRDYRRGWEL
jgi:predicted dehydrogenase